MAPRTPLALAALASVAVRGLEPVATQQHGAQDGDIDAAVVHDERGRRWLIRSPATPAAAARLEQECRLLAQLERQPLPFPVPVVLGMVALPEGGRAAVQQALSGTPLQPGALAAGPGLAAELGRALAAVHDLPVSVVEEAGLPVYEAEEYRQRRLAELDRAAATGHVPAPLLARWERALEEAGAWRFVPAVVHADLAAENVLVDDDHVAGVLEWGEARVADPADDLAWIASAAEPDAFESVLEAYAYARRGAPDRDVARRARLAGELAVARWLLHGMTTDDEGIVADAVTMLDDLDAAVSGQPW